MYRIDKEIKIEGIGLHTGKKTSIILKPISKLGYYINNVKINPYLVVNPNRSTNIQVKNKKLYTIEHLFSIFYGLNINSINICFDEKFSEIPIFDGSSSYFYNILKDNLVENYNSKWEYTQLNTPITIQISDKYIKYIPPWSDCDKSLNINMKINFNNKIVDVYVVDIYNSYIKEEIYKAKTFGFQYEIEKLKEKNLIQGASLNSAIIITNDYTYNENIEHELIKHKILDLLGDISLINRKIYGTIYAYKTGHLLNNLLAKSIFSLIQE